MKIAVLLCFFMSIEWLQAQQSYTGRLSFTSVDGMLLLEGSSPHTFVKFTATDCRVSFKTQVSAFAFSNCSRQVEKMFNDVYMESHKHHWLAYSGILSTVDSCKVPLNAPIFVPSNGMLDVHGVKIPYTIPFYMAKDSLGGVTLTAAFKVSTKAHQIPKIKSPILTLNDTLQMYLHAELKK